MNPHFVFSVAHWLQKTLDTVLSLGKVLVLSKSITKKSLVSEHQCLVLGNGPSLAFTCREEKQALSSMPLIAVNLFSCTPEFVEFKPSFYVLLDAAFADEKHVNGKKGIDGLIENTKWPLQLLVPQTFKKSAYFINRIQQNTFIHVVFFNYTIFEGFNSIKWFFFDKGYAMPQCQNVLQAAVFQAIHLGFTTVWLTGADHTWHEDILLDDENKLKIQDQHFYESKKDITSYFIQENQKTSYLSRAFLSLHKVFRGYEIIAEYADYKKVKIVNASRRSYIDVFEKRKLSNGIER